MDRAYSFADANYGVASALKWAHDKGWHGIPSAAVAKDSLAFEQAGFSLSHLAQHRMAQLAQHRLSHAKITQAISRNNPERLHITTILFCEYKYMPYDFTSQTYYFSHTFLFEVVHQILPTGFVRVAKLCESVLLYL